jgi:GT2 family glycosyltransferase
MNNIAAAIETQVQSAKVGVVLVNWNSFQLTSDCIQSLQNSSIPPWKIIVVDNASADGSGEIIAKTHPTVHMILNSENLGFTGGNNIGIEHLMSCGADFVWILNNDTVVDVNCLEVLLREMDNSPELSACSAKILFHDVPDTIWYAGGIVDRNKLTHWHTGEHEKDLGQYDTKSDVSFLSGCCILARASTIKNIGLFDDSFFAYMEDVDWSIRATKSGCILRYVPEAKLWHKVSSSFKKTKTGSSKDRSSSFVVYLYQRNIIFIIRKHSINSWHKFYLVSSNIKFILIYSMGYLVTFRFNKLKHLIKAAIDGYSTRLDYRCQLA